MSIYKEKREHTKNILMDSFWELYEKKSINQITVKDITDNAGYNRATFYVHFKDVNDILQCIEDKLFEAFDFQHIGIDNFNQENQLITSINIFSANEKYFRVLLSSKGDPHFVAKCKEKLKELLCSINKVNATPTGKNTDLVIEYIIGGLLNCILYWLDEKPFSEKELFESLYKLIVTCQQLF